MGTTSELLLRRLPQIVDSFEIVVIDDGSADRTWAIAEEMARADPRVRAVRHAANAGVGAAFVTGVGAASGDWLIVVPADLAIDLDDLPRYLEASRDADVVVGYRSHKRDYSAYRRLVSWMNIKLIQLLFGMREKQFQYVSLYRMSVLRSMRIEFYKSAFFLAEILIKAKALGFRLAAVEATYVPRRHGRATGARFRFTLRTLADMIRFRFGGWRKMPRSR